MKTNSIMNRRRIQTLTNWQTLRRRQMFDHAKKQADEILQKREQERRNTIAL